MIAKKLSEAKEYVAPNHRACSTLRLFGAEAGDGFKAAIAISPGAESWDGNKPLDARLLQAVDNIKIPVFVIHPAKDASLNPGFNLGPEFQKLGKPYGLKIFPPFGPAQAQGHCFPGQGTQIC